MKNLAKILICMILCVFTMGLVSCGREQVGIFDKISGEVYGNGGLAVVKGEYVFFVNGFNKAEDMTEKNDSYVGDKVGALMVAKLDSNGAIILNDKDLLHDDYYKVMSDKLCGFEASSLSIYGDYLYFTSPCQQDDTNETWAKKRVDFYRININDRKGKVERIYQSGVEYDKLEFAYYNNNGVYLMVREKDTNLDDDSKTNVLYRVKADNKEVTEVASKVTSTSIADNNASCVYFVSEDEDVKLVRYDYANNAKTEETLSKSVEVKFADNHYAYIVRESATNSSRKELVRASVNGGGFGSRICYTDLYDNLYLTPDSSAVVAVKSNYIDYYTFGNSTPYNIYMGESEETISIVGLANGSIVFINGDNVIKSVSYSTHMTAGSADVITIATVSDIDTTYYDIDDQYVYFYKSIGSNKYLHRLSINNNEGTSTEEMLGVYVEADIPEDDTSSEE